MGLCCSQEDDGPQSGIQSHGDAATQESVPAPYELPAGWKAVPSRSRPGKLTHLNIHTGERISWVPTEDAKTYKGAITKKKKKKPKTKVPGADASETTPLKSGENTSSASDMPASQTLTQA